MHNNSKKVKQKSNQGPEKPITSFMLIFTPCLAVTLSLVTSIFTIPPQALTYLLHGFFYWTASVLALGVYEVLKQQYLILEKLEEKEGETEESSEAEKPLPTDLPTGF